MRPSLLKIRMRRMPGSLPMSWMTLIERLAVVAQHLVMRAALDHVGDALGRFHHHLLELAALLPQIEIAEQSNKAAVLDRHASLAANQPVWQASRLN